MTSAQTPGICPKCGQSDRKFEVRRLYMESLAFVKPGEKEETPELDRFFEVNNFMDESASKKRHIVEDMIKSFAPPSGKPQLLKTISPDMMMVVFSAISVYLLFQIYTTQHSIFWITAVIFGLFIASYIIFHKSIIRRFQNQKDLDTSSKEVIEKAIAKWMKLDYCARDNVVFMAKKSEFVPLDEMNEYLLKSSVKKAERSK